jgi:hypothetical protein
VAIPVDVEVKLNRARHHIAALEAEIKPLAAACGKAVVRSQDSQTNEIIYRIDGLPTIDPMLSAIAGDAIHNLRSCLDHLADALVRASGNTPTTDTSFPILSKAPTPNRHGTATPPQIAGGISMSARCAVDEVQPYKRDRPEFHQLHVLHRLDIQDKHRGLILSVFRSPFIGWWGDDVDITAFNSGPYRDGDELARFSIDEATRAGQDSVATFKFVVGIQAAESGPHAERMDAATFLRRLPLYYIEERVLPRFAALLC